MSDIFHGLYNSRDCRISPRHGVREKITDGKALFEKTAGDMMCECGKYQCELHTLRLRPVSYENRIILRAIILNTHGSREAPKTHGLTYVLLAQNFGVIRRKILVKFCTLKNGF